MKANDQLVRDTLAEYDLIPEDFGAYNAAIGLYACPDCMYRSEAGTHAVSMHYCTSHEGRLRNAIAGAEAWHAILETLHCEYKLNPTEISDGFDGTLGATTIREDLKALGIYDPQIRQKARHGIAASLEKMTVEEFDAALAGDVE